MCLICFIYGHINTKPKQWQPPLFVAMIYHVGRYVLVHTVNSPHTLVVKTYNVWLIDVYLFHSILLYRLAFCMGFSAVNVEIALTTLLSFH